jgi:hypothetical protein
VDREQPIGWRATLALLLLLAGCPAPQASIELDDPGPSIPPPGDGSGPDDDDGAPDDDDGAPDDDDGAPDDDDAVGDDDPIDPIAPCGIWAGPGEVGVTVSSSFGEALLTPTVDSSSWFGCEVRRVFDGAGEFVCEDFWQVTGHRTGGALEGDVYRLDFTWVAGLSSCPDDGADVVLRYAVQPLAEEELNLYRSDPVGEPLWFWVTRGAWEDRQEAMGISYRTGWVAWE